MLINKKNTMKFRFLKTIAVITAVSALSSCSQSVNTAQNTNDGYKGKQPKYIFYFIGDGMSQPQITMAEKALNEPEFYSVFQEQTCGIYSDYKQGGKLNLKRFPNMGMATTNAENRFITCSAAAATALATGHKTTINTISKNGERTENLKTVAEMARDCGMKVGVISSVSIDHATPACFYAHEDDRNNYENIGHWLLKSGYDFFGGGNVRWHDYKDMTNKQFYDSLKQKGYTVSTDLQTFNSLNKNTGKIFATISKNIDTVIDASTLPYNIDLDIQKSDDDRIVLRDFVRKAVEVLYNEDKGFFLMTEGGKIDWTDHANDAVSNVYETIALDAAIGVALDFYEKHPDETLIVFTGDHECGGLTLGFAGTHYESAFNLMKNQHISYQEFSDQDRKFFGDKKRPTFQQTLDRVKENFGLGDTSKGLGLSDYEVKRLKIAYDEVLKFLDKKESSLSKEERYLYYGNYDYICVTATHILDNKAGVDWASYSHTALPVPVYSIGAGSELLKGYFDNTDIPNTIMKVANLK